jgi:hypothetical protein
VERIFVTDGSGYNRMEAKIVDMSTVWAAFRKGKTALFVFE